MSVFSPARYTPMAETYLQHFYNSTQKVFKKGAAGSIDDRQLRPYS